MAEDDRAPVLRYVDEVWNGYGQEAIDDIVSPRYANHVARTEEYQRGRARRAVGCLLCAFPDHRFEVEDAAADGEMVVLRGTMTGTHEWELQGVTPTGERVAVEQSYWFRMVDGKVAEHWAVRDDLGILQQLGVITS